MQATVAKVSHLVRHAILNGFQTYPKVYSHAIKINSLFNLLLFDSRVSEKTREARRVMLSDINFTSMVPELSRSADHLCHGEEQQNIDNNNGDGNDYSKGPFLKTPDYANRGYVNHHIPLDHNNSKIQMYSVEFSYYRITFM